MNSNQEPRQHINTDNVDRERERETRGNHDDEQEVEIGYDAMCEDGDAMGEAEIAASS